MINLILLNMGKFSTVLFYEISVNHIILLKK